MFGNNKYCIVYSPKSVYIEIMKTLTEEQESILEQIADKYIKAKAEKHREIEGKMLPNDFTMTEKKSEYIISGVFILGFIFMIALFAYFYDGIPSLILITMISILLLVSFYIFISMLRYKITVSNNQITYMYGFRKNKTVNFDYITMVKVSVNIYKIEIDAVVFGIKINAYHEDKILFSFTPAMAGCNILVSRLKNMGIPFSYIHDRSQ